MLLKKNKNKFRNKGDPVEMKRVMVNRNCVHLPSCTIAIKPSGLKGTKQCI